MFNNLKKTILLGATLTTLTLAACQPQSVEPQAVAPRTAPAKKKPVLVEPDVKATDDEQPPKTVWPFS